MMKGMCVWLQGISSLLQVITGAVIVGIEVEIIHEESPGTPGAFSLLHQDEAVKGLCQLLGRIVMCMQLCRSTRLTVLLGLIMSSMNCLTLAFLIWQCGYGISDIQRKCDMYPDYCAASSSMVYGKTLLQTQEAMFDTGTFSCLVSMVILTQYIRNTVAELEYKSLTQQAELARQHEKFNDAVVFDE